MNEILSPIKEKLISFEKKVEETYDKELRTLGAKVKKKLPQALLDRINEEKAVE